MSEYLTKLHDIDTFIFDVDGVMTDGNIYLVNGTMSRKMSTRDGYALRKAVDKGYKVIVITGGSSEDVKKRLNLLKIDLVYLGVQNKLDRLEDLVISESLNLENCLYMGDDWPDYECMKAVGLPVAPADAIHELKEISKYISPFRGGEGCVRDIIEQVLKVQGNWN